MSSPRTVPFLLCLVAVQSAAIASLLFLATQDSTTHYNLGYLLWKGGFKHFESTIALPGMLHDISYRKELVGTSLADFQKMFPSTFHEVKKLPPLAKPNQRFFVADYWKAQREDGAWGQVWGAIFEDDKLVELEFSKG